MPLSVSIVIPLYGRPNEIRACVQSLAASLDLIEEIVVIDNASPDDACEVAESFEYVQVVRNAKNRGFAGACNQGAALTKGAYVLFLNSDTIVPRNGLKTLIRAANLHHARVAAFGPVSNYAGNEQRIHVSHHTMSDIEALANSLATDTPNLSFTNLLSGFCLLINREVFDELGGFDERFIFGNFEDDDLCRRMSVSGHTMAIVNNAFIHHFGARSIVTLPLDVGALHDRNQAEYRRKWGAESGTGKRIAIIGGCGYIGSALYRYLKATGYCVESYDLELRGQPLEVRNNCVDYRNLTPESFARYDWVVFLAAHSSVAACTADVWGAVDNNLVGFAKVLKSLGNAKIVYASSGSVYNGLPFDECVESTTRFGATNVYDVTKMCADLLAAQVGVQSFALRLGTVNGPSPNLRGELMINKMVADALRTKTVTVSNESAYRAVLCINDLCRALEQIMRSPVSTGVYNLASFSKQIGAIATEVAEMLGAQVVTSQSDNPYSFVLDTTKFQQALGFKFEGSVESIVEQLVSQQATVEQPL